MGPKKTIQGHHELKEIPGHCANVTDKLFGLNGPEYSQPPVEVFLIK